MQAKEALERGYPTREGGHEYVSALVEKHPTYQNIIVTSYWLGNDKSKLPFRFRFYGFEDDSSGKYLSRMKLYKPKPDSLVLLKETMYNSSKYLPSLNEMDEIVGCDIGWTWEEDGNHLIKNYF